VFHLSNRVEKKKCFFTESILGCGGQVILPKNYLKEIFSEIRRNNALCIVDEVQTGFGRVGRNFWSFEEHDVVPDIVTLGKPMGNGHPIAAVITTEKIASTFNNGMEYFNSFGGNPVSCAIGKAVLETIDNNNLQKNALLSSLEKIKFHQNIKLSERNRRALNLLLDLKNRQITTITLLKACLFREESRGGHYRDDFPRKEKNWECHTRQQLNQKIQKRFVKN